MRPERWIENNAGRLPGDAGVAFYREHGYFVTGKILPDDILDAALAAVEPFYAGETDHPAPAGASPGWCAADGDRVLRKNDFASFQMDALAALVHHPELGAAAAQLAGEPVRLWMDQLLYKPPDRPDAKTRVGWHTDRRYWRCCTSTDMLTAWIPFGDCSARDGTLMVVDGSHRWPDNADAGDFRSQELDELEQHFVTDGHPVVKVPVELERGQVSFHHCQTLHGSGPNRGARPRIALAVHLQGASNRWCEFVYRMPDGSTHRHDLEHMCRLVGGVPDFADPKLCPQLWPA